MKTLGTYSQKKFQTLSAAGQEKAINRLLCDLEISLGDPDKTSSLLGTISECLFWMKEPAPSHLLQLSHDLREAKDAYQISQAITAFHAAQGKDLTDSQLHVIKGDGPRHTDSDARKRAQSVIIILDNLRSVFNIGSIFRSAECLGVQAVWLCGICATPENPALNKTAMNTADLVPWRHFPTTQLAIEAAKSEGYTVFALETTQDSASVFAARFTFPLALVLGNESLGIAEDVLALCDKHVSLPVQGWKNSLNVAVACAVASYQIIFGKQSGEKHG